MNANFSIVAQLSNPSNNLVCSVAAASAPTVILQTVVPTKAGSPPYYTTPFSVTFNGLTYGVGYIFSLWESPDMTAQGTRLNYSNFTALGQSIVLRATLFVTADSTTGFNSGQPTYADSSLVGWTYDLFNGQVGLLQPGVDATINTNGWILSGRNAQPGEVFSMSFQPQVSTSPPPAPSGPTSGLILTADTVLDSTAVNKRILLQGAVMQYFTTTLPPLSTVSDYDPIYINSIGGSHVNAVVKCSGSDKMQRNTQITQIILGQNEKLFLYKANGVWVVDYVSPGVDNVGQYVWGAINSGINFQNLAGTVIARNVYLRLTTWILATQTVIAQSTWAATDAFGNFINKAFYAAGDGSTTIQLPLITGFVTSRNGSILPGTYTIQNVGAHTHLSGIAVDGSSIPPSVYGTSTAEIPGLAGAIAAKSIQTATRQALTGGNIAPGSGPTAPNTNTIIKPADVGVYINVLS